MIPLETKICYISTGKMKEKLSHISLRFLLDIKTSKIKHATRLEHKEKYYNKENKEQPCGRIVKDSRSRY